MRSVNFGCRTFLILTLTTLSLFARDAFITDQNQKDANPHVAQCGVIETQELRSSFNSRGTFSDGIQCRTYFETPIGSELIYLFAGAIWIGGIVDGDTLVSTGADGWSNPSDDFFTALSLPVMNQHSFDSTLILQCLMNDTFVNVIDDDGAVLVPMNIEISNRAAIFKSGDAEKTIIHDLIITNIGDKHIENGYVGIYLDADVGYEPDCNAVNCYDDDLSGSIRELGISYSIDNNADYNKEIPTGYKPDRVFAFKYLNSSFVPTDTNFNWWAGGHSGTDFGPRRKDDQFREFVSGNLGYARTDRDKYYLLSHPEWDYDQIFTNTIIESDPLWLYPDQSMALNVSRGLDTRTVMSIGPFNLMPDSSIRVQFSMFTADNFQQDYSNWSNNLYPNYNPDQYLNNLNFTDLYEVATCSDSLAQILLDPSIPPFGLRIIHNDINSTVMKWDPWVYDDVTGYEIYLSNLDLDIFPYPGVLPPWLKPEISESNNFYSDHNFITFDTLKKNNIYYVNVAQISGNNTGSISDPIFINIREHFGAPVIYDNFVFTPKNTPLTINWYHNVNENMDHYNIYKFESNDYVYEYTLFHPFYDINDLSFYPDPFDSFTVDAVRYNYYQMKPYAQVDAGVFEFTDLNFTHGQIYIIEGVNTDGFRSEFSSTIRGYELEPPTKDFLVVTQSRNYVNSAFIEYGSLVSFYDSVMNGYTFPYNYDLYFYADSISLANKFLSLELLSDYKFVIFDDDITEDLLGLYSNDSIISEYIHSGGNYIQFGSFPAITNFGLGFSNYSTNPYWFTNKYFGIDSIYYAGLSLYMDNPEFETDFLLGFYKATSISEEFPDLYYDNDRPIYQDRVYSSFHWPDSNSMPYPITFKINERAEEICTFTSLYPETSLMEGKTIGLKTNLGLNDTYLFGFHLYCMQHDDARELIDIIYNYQDNPNCCDMPGDADNDGSYSISDLTYYIKFAFGSGTPPVCLEEFDNDGDCDLDIMDIVWFIDFLFRNGSPPVNCHECLNKITL